MRSFSPTEVIIATHPEGRSNWLEHGLVAQARERFDVPITHVAVDAVHDEARLVEREPADPVAPARERHTSRDLSLLAVVGVLAILGSLISFIFYASDAPDWAHLDVGPDLRPRVQDRGRRGALGAVPAARQGRSPGPIAGPGPAR